jgi:hypothetical protein
MTTLDERIQCYRAEPTPWTIGRREAVYAKVTRARKSRARQAWFRGVSATALVGAALVSLVHLSSASSPASVSSDTDRQNASIANRYDGYNDGGRVTD